ncbi:hypothetical protein ZHAS_00002669 [Anopheles sinensis]|uniref:Uncharacterized protein n=1 Tax=Anopheles sinensis TaxID=74873 RepID=A0A084VCS1_ANOSI|nr:hypothetical protein ZHAS_00002669 [Anopheles sinensis]
MRDGRENENVHSTSGIVGHGNSPDSAVSARRVPNIGTTSSSASERKDRNTQN